jgi:hypothetical protein
LGRSVLLAIVLALTCAAGRAPAVTFWDADLNEQPLGKLPTGLNADGPPDLPTFLRAGSTYEVVRASGDLADQPLEVVNKVGSVPRASFRLEQAEVAPVRDGLISIELDMLGGACENSRNDTCYEILVLREGGRRAASLAWTHGGMLRLGPEASFEPLPYTVDDTLLGTSPLPADLGFDGLAVMGAGPAAGRYAIDNVLIQTVPRPRATSSAR